MLYTLILTLMCHSKDTRLLIICQVPVQQAIRKQAYIAHVHYMRIRRRWYEFISNGS